jgi:hypothetical protein
VKLEAVDRGDLTVQMAPQLVPDVGHHRRRRARIQAVPIPADLLHSECPRPDLDADALDVIAHMNTNVHRSSIRRKVFGAPWRAGRLMSFGLYRGVRGGIAALAIKRGAAVIAGSAIGDRRRGEGLERHGPEALELMEFHPLRIGVHARPQSVDKDKACAGREGPEQLSSLNFHDITSQFRDLKSEFK